GFFAFGIQNESKGYEIRSASDQYVFKSVLKQRDITYIKGNKGQGTTVNVFEGMLDFLSLLTLLNVPRLNGDTIIMHSTSTYDRCKAFLELGNFKMINTFLDNDPTGKKCTKKFEEDFHGKVASQSFQFKAFEDLNEVLKNGQKIQFQLLPNP
ncbi:MAG: toprim domain-containing protein, partial [Bacteroidota bacterium]